MKWIPCSERLPRKNGTYLVTFEWTGKTGNKYIEIEGIDFERGRWDCHDYEKVTAWMPLPKPYRKTENSSEKPNNSTISKMEQVDEDINVRSKDEEYINNLPWKEVGNGEQTDDAYFLELMGAVERGEISDAGANQAWYEYINHKDEPQTDCAWMPTLCR